MANLTTPAAKPTAIVAAIVIAFRWPLVIAVLILAAMLTFKTQLGDAIDKVTKGEVSWHDHEVHVKIEKLAFIVLLK